MPCIETVLLRLDDIDFSVDLEELKEKAENFDEIDTIDTVYLGNTVLVIIAGSCSAKALW